MDNPQIIDDNLGGFAFSSEIKSYLAETAKWGKFLAIVGFVFIGLMALFGLFFGSFMSNFAGGELFPVSPMIFTVMYLLIAALYFFPVLYLYRFSTKMQVALRLDNERDLTESFSNLKSLYKFMGIMTAVILGIYALLFVFGAIGRAMMGM